MSQQSSIFTSATRTFGSLALAGLALAGTSSGVFAAALQEGARVAKDADTSKRAPLGSIDQIVQSLVTASDAQLAGLRLRWSHLPVELQLRLAIGVRELDCDRIAELLVVMLDTRDATVRALVCDALRAETGAQLPDSPELWKQWIDAEKLWLRMRGAAALEGLRSSDEAAVIAATREIAQHRLLKRAFAGEVERNLGRISPAIRSVTARALGELGDPSSRDALRVALTDQAPAVRREAQAALGRLAPEVG